MEMIINLIKEYKKDQEELVKVLKASKKINSARVRVCFEDEIIIQVMYLADKIKGLEEYVKAHKEVIKK